ncbi:MAG: glutamine synthetase, partial [Clostridiales bacterium]|nr:glutamine synthetase [Clostridiales bacterium]
DGIEKGLTPPEEITENIFEMDADERAACGIEDLPDSLEHALVALEADPLMAQVLGPHIFTQYVAGKEKEWEEYCTRVSSWEIAKYMVLY